MYSEDHRTIVWHLDYIPSPEQIDIPAKVSSSKRSFSFRTIRNRLIYCRRKNILTSSDFSLLFWKTWSHYEREMVEMINPHQIQQYFLQ